MKKTLHFCATIAFGLALGLSLGSCKDNDLTDGGINGGDGTEMTEAEAQKYEALQTLLGSLASVDSLPNNWNSDTYQVSPTIGIEKDAATPHVRYVVTTSQAEADRLYRSYLSKDVSATPANDEWQMDGIGSLQFKLENNDDLFATLKVNVQQLPTLEEIRFVSEKSLGNNGAIAPKGCYYTFGDIIYQDVADRTKDGDVHTPTFWVCVRPCSTNPNRRISHWCTFQLVPAGYGTDQNYLQVDNCYLPTQLSFSKSDAECHIQNFFNVLRIMANPDIAKEESYRGIDDITTSNEVAQYVNLRNNSFLWNYFDIWNREFGLFIPKKDGDNENKTELDNSISEDNQSSSGSDQSGIGGATKDYDWWASVINKDFQDKKLDEILNTPQPTIDAFYYGYSKNYFSKGDYTVYNLHLSTASPNGLFQNVKKQTAYVKRSDNFNFQNFGSGDPLATKVYFSNNAERSNYQLIVKYRTGAELEDAGYSHSKNDIAPERSFQERPSNRITDVLVARELLNKSSYKNGDENKSIVSPFFSFGDVVTKWKVKKNNFEGYYFCTRQVGDYCNIIDDKNYSVWSPNYATFIGYQNNENMNDEILVVEDVKIVLYELALAYINYGDLDDNIRKALLKQEPNENSPFMKGLKPLYDNIAAEGYITFICNKISDTKYEANLYAILGEYAYMFTIETGNEGKNTYKLTNIYDNDDDYNIIKRLKKLSSYKYKDKYAYKEEFSTDRTLYLKKKEDRDKLRESVITNINALLSGFTN